MLKDMLLPKETLEKVRSHVLYQGYVVAMSTIIQVEPPTFEEAVK